MNSLHPDSVQFLKPDNDEGLSGNPSLTCILNTSLEGISTITKTKNNIVYCIEKYQITILATEVGIGILNLPQFFEELGWIQKGKIAVIDQNYETFMSSPENFHNQTILEGIHYLSNEQFLKELFLDPLLTKYSIILVNNANKRNILIDTVLALIKKIVRKRSSLKIILVSNTREAIFFSEYYSIYKRQHGHHQVTCKIVSVDDINMEQKVFYLKSPCADYVRKSIETIVNIHQKHSLDGDVLIYLATEDEINQALELLKNYIGSEKIKNLNYFKLLVNGERQSVFIPKASGKRNVIFTTDLSQDLVTQDHVSYVVDCGFMQMKWFDADKNKSHNITVPESKTVAELRATWRNKHRKANIFRLFTKEDFYKLPEKAIVEMRRTNLCSVILYLKTLAIDNILGFDFPSAPPAKNVLSALETLYALGALDDKGQLVNTLGFFMADSPFCPHLSKVLFNSNKFQCSEEILTIVAMLQVDTVFAITNNNMADRHKQVAKRVFESAEGDLITLLNIYTAFIENNKTKDFCRKYYLNYRNLMRVYNLRNYFENYLLKKYKIGLVSSHGDVESILKCITSGYFMNVAYLHANGTYRGLRCKSELYIDRDSSIYSLPQPKYLLYCELYEKSKTFMHNVTTIKEEWLTELAPHYYKMK